MQGVYIHTAAEFVAGTSVVVVVVVVVVVGVVVYSVLVEPGVGVPRVACGG